MLIDASDARGVVRINGKVVAYAERGTLVPEKPGWLSLRNLILAKGGYRLLLDPDEDQFQNLDEEDYKRLLDWLLEQGCRAPSWLDALSKEFEIEIRNSDGSSTFFGSCWADKGGLGLSQMPTTEPLPSVDFCSLDLV